MIDEFRDCSCGLRLREYDNEDRRAHEVHHLQWALGVPLTTAARRAVPREEVAVRVDRDSRRSLVTIASEVGRQFHIELGYDWPLVSRGAEARYEKRAYLWLVGGTSPLSMPPTRSGLPTTSRPVEPSPRQSARNSTRTVTGGRCKAYGSRPSGGGAGSAAGSMRRLSRREASPPTNWCGRAP